LRPPRGQLVGDGVADDAGTYHDDVHMGILVGSWRLVVGGWWLVVGPYS
jgi:hypothetical protein